MLSDNVLSLTLQEMWFYLFPWNLWQLGILITNSLPSFAPHLSPQANLQGFLLFSNKQNTIKTEKDRKTFMPIKKQPMNTQRKKTQAFSECHQRCGYKENQKKRSQGYAPCERTSMFPHRGQVLRAWAGQGEEWSWRRWTRVAWTNKKQRNFGWTWVLGLWIWIWGSTNADDPFTQVILLVILPRWGWTQEETSCSCPGVSCTLK